MKLKVELCDGPAVTVEVPPGRGDVFVYRDERTGKVYAERGRPQILQPGVFILRHYKDGDLDERGAA